MPTTIRGGDSPGGINGPSTAPPSSNITQKIKAIMNTMPNSIHKNLIATLLYHRLLELSLTLCPD